MAEWGVGSTRAAASWRGKRRALECSGCTRWVSTLSHPSLSFYYSSSSLHSPTQTSWSDEPTTVVAPRSHTAVRPALLLFFLTPFVPLSSYPSVPRSPSTSSHDLYSKPLAGSHSVISFPSTTTLTTAVLDTLHAHPWAMHTEGRADIARDYIVRAERRDNEEVTPSFYFGVSFTLEENERRKREVEGMLCDLDLFDSYQDLESSPHLHSFRSSGTWIINCL